MASLWCSLFSCHEHCHLFRCPCLWLVDIPLPGPQRPKGLSWNTSSPFPPGHRPGIGQGRSSAQPHFGLIWGPVHRCEARVLAPPVFIERGALSCRQVLLHPLPYRPGVRLWQHRGQKPCVASKLPHGSMDALTTAHHRSEPQFPPL